MQLTPMCSVLIQVLRALKPPLTADMCSTLLLCLQQCLAAAPSSAIAREVALELLLTVRSLLEVLPARKLLLYPQVFWASLSLLFSSYVHLYQQALILLSTCLQHLTLNDSTTQHILVAAAPVVDPKELQQLLAGSQTSRLLDTTNRSGRTTPVAQGRESPVVRGDSARSRYGAARIRSPETCSRGSPAAGSDPAAARPAATAVTSSIQSFVGGSDPDGARPVHWAVGQLLPWPERGPDGPAHHMITVQQVLFKGLLFQDTQLPAVQLLTQLAKGLCQLAPSAATPVQGPLDNSGSSRDQRVQESSHGSRHRATASVDGVPGSRPATDVPSRSNSRGPTVANSVLDAASGIARAGKGDSSVSATLLQQEQLLGETSSQNQQTGADEPAGGKSSSTHNRGVSMGGTLVSDTVTSAAEVDATAVSRSAPELQALLASTSAADTQLSQDSNRQPLGAADRSKSSKRVADGGAALTSLSSSWGAWHTLVKGSTVSASTTSKNLPGTKAAFQSLLGHRHAQLLVTIASIVPFFCSQLGQLEPNSELLEALQECMLTLSAACSAQGLTQLGSKVQQFATSLNMNLRRSTNSSPASSSNNPPQQLQQQQDQVLIKTSHGQPALGKVSTSSSAGSISFKQQSSVGTSGSLGLSRGQLNLLQSPRSPANSALVHLLQGLCLQLSRALLPTYADWLLRFWMGVLLLPGAAALHPHVLLLLRCLFATPGLQLGPAAGLLLDSSFVSPIVNLSQGPLWQYALDTLDAIMQFAASSQELQQYQQQQNLGGSGNFPGGLSSSSTPLSAGAAATSATPAAAQQQGVDLKGLAACLLPQLDVVQLLQRVLSSCTGPPKRRKYRLLPFIGETAAASQQQVDRVKEE
eukprot:GHUV01018538.1.p1 GENE.GHUV01018538.1~~GHUV01018538.1.p1  ORF type:complete len:869 (+),score=314.27 GHUV01018538.1:690-3296(+)